MPIKPETLERRRKKLTRLVIEKDFNLAEVARAKGVSRQAIAQAVDRYGIHEEYARIAEDLHFGNKEAIKELIETHIKGNKDREALTFHLKQLNAGKETAPTNLNIKNINVITSEAYKQAKEKFEGKAKEDRPEVPAQEGVEVKTAQAVEDNG